MGLFIFLILSTIEANSIVFDFVVMLNLFSRRVSFLYFGLVLRVRRWGFGWFVCSFSTGVDINEFGLDFLH